MYGPIFEEIPKSGSMNDMNTDILLREFCVEKCDANRANGDVKLNGFGACPSGSSVFSLTLQSRHDNLDATLVNISARSCEVLRTLKSPEPPSPPLLLATANRRKLATRSTRVFPKYTHRSDRVVVVCRRARAF